MERAPINCSFNPVARAHLNLFYNTMERVPTRSNTHITTAAEWQVHGQWSIQPRVEE